MSDQSILDLPDEEVLNTPYSQFMEDVAPSDEKAVDEVNEDTEDDDLEESIESENEYEEDTEEDSYEESDTFNDGDEDLYEDDSNTEDDDNSEYDDEESEEETDSVDYEKAYKEVFKPFKANGKEIKINTPEEAIQLMQMGANYNKKMAGIKEQLPYLKMLEKNQLLDTDKLSYAIDLLNGDERAIAKLVKEHDLDLYDIEEDEDYAPSDKSVSKQELEFTEVVEELQNSNHYDRTLEVVREEMDDNSKRFIVENPQVMKVIESHIDMGIYDTIKGEVDRLNAIDNRLNGLSSLEAYKVVGDSLNEQGKLGNPNQESKQDSKQKKAQQTKQKRKAAAKPKSNPTPKNNNKTISPLEMSDEEFAKLSGMSHLR